jgi:hypothetical protein
MRRGYGPLAALVVLFLGVGALALFVPSGSAVHRAALVLWGAIPTAAALWEYAYRRIEAHRLLVNRARFWLSNPESRWGLTAEFDVADPKLAMEQAVSGLQGLLGPGDQALSQSPELGVWQIQGLTLRLVADIASDPLDGDGQPLLRVEFPPAPRSFRKWRHVISETASAVMETIEKRVQPLDQKYVVTVGFPGENPYFGLFVNNVARAAVTRFEVDYFEQRATGRDVVRVRKDRMEMVTSSMHAARQLSLHYLALGPAGGS